MSELHVTFDGHLHVFAPGTTARIGRSADNDVVVADPTVSRRHAQLSWQASGWTWQNAGQAPTFLDGQPVRSFAIGQQVDVHLGSPQGPALRLQAAGVPQAPIKTELAAAAPAGPAGPAAPGVPTGAAAAAPPPTAYAAPGRPGGQPQQAAPWQPAGTPWPAVGQAVPPGMPGAVPPGMGQPGAPGWPGYAPQAPGYSPGAQLDVGSFFQTLIPIKSWLHDKGWHQGLRLLIIPYALLPLIFIQIFAHATSLTTPGWAYSIYVAPLWLLVFWYFIRPPRWNWVPELAIAIGLVIWEWIWLHVVTININDHFVVGPANHPYSFNLFRALIVGFNEEISKALPVLIAAAVLLGVQKKKLDPRTWMVMGTISGLTFGVIEQSLYTPAAIVQVHLAGSISTADQGALSFAFRVFVDGFQHAVWAGISGFFIGLAINYPRRRYWLLLLGICIPAVLHALNDWTLNIFYPDVLFTVFVIQGLSLLLFLGYTLSASSIERSVRANPAFRRDQSMLMERYNLPAN